MDWHEDGLTVGRVAERMQMTRSAVRWYDDHGLLPSTRTAGNQRRFFADVCCRLAMIRAAQRVGLTIADIGEALSALPPGQAPTPEDWEQLAARLRNDVNHRIQLLYSVLEELKPAPVLEAPATSGAHPTEAGHGSR